MFAIIFNSKHLTSRMFSFILKNMNTPISVLTVNMCGKSVRPRSLTPTPYKTKHNWFFLPLSGKIHFKNMDFEIDLVPEHFYILPAHEVFSLIDIEDCEFDHLYVAFELSHPIHSFYDIPLGHNRFLKDILKLIVNNYTKIDSIVMGTLIKSILHHVLPQQSNNTDIASNIKNYIDKHIPNFSIEDVCKNFHYGKRYLDMKFKETFGISMTKYGKNEQFAYVANSLADGMSLGEICDKLQYSSPANLSRDFTKHFGSSPSEHKKAIKTLLT